MKESVSVSPVQQDQMYNVKVYPSPFVNRISIEVSCNHAETSIVSMMNQDQKIIKMFSWHLKPGINKTTLDGLSSLEPGSYYIDLKDLSGNVAVSTSVDKQ